jgi:hypothetical protein
MGFVWNRRNSLCTGNPSKLLCTLADYVEKRCRMPSGCATKPSEERDAMMSDTQSKPSCAYDQDGQRCQFEDTEPLSSCGDGDYCDWHLPASAKAEWPPARLEEFQARLVSRVDNLVAQEKSFDFTGVVFPDRAYFAKRTLRKARFCNATFMGTVNFGSSIFDGVTNFTSAHFTAEAHFRAVEFTAEVLFNGAQFADKADFSTAVFKRNVNFCHAVFDDFASFYQTTFELPTSFEYAVFQKKALFHCAAFRSNANFGHCIFHLTAMFIAAEFGDLVSFEQSAFHFLALFAAPPEKDKAVLRRSLWMNAYFHASVSFENRIFASAGDFSGATFVRAPEFHGCTLHQAMVFPKMRHFKDTRSADAAQAYRTLKLGMAAMKARQEEGMFFTLEQRSLRNSALEAWATRVRDIIARSMQRLRRKPQGPSTYKLQLNADREAKVSMGPAEVALSWLYDGASEFGRNPFRPALGVLVVCLGFALLYAMINGQHVAPNAPINLPLLKNSLLCSVQQIVRPFYIWDAKTAFCGRISRTLILVASLQTVFSLGLVSLSLLALNWRFKRD